MKHKIIFEKLGTVEYQKAWDYQESLLAKIAAQKDANMNPTDNYLLFCEHTHVYTLGKSGLTNNLLVNDDFLKSINATFVKTNRGGDITYHGPGQIVGYPILNLDNFNIGIKQYIHNIEEIIIKTLSRYNIKGERLEGATGVWLDTSDAQKCRKICAIGVRSSHWITMHGFAFNVNTNLGYFNHINPCGYTDKGITSMEKELGRQVQIDEVSDTLKKVFREVFNTEL